MSIDWREVARIGATGAVGAVPALQPFAPIIVPLIQAIFRSSDEDLMAKWLENIEDLERSKHRVVGKFDNAARARMMKGMIEWDLYKKNEKKGLPPPPKSDVNFLLEALIKVYWGVENGVAGLDAAEAKQGRVRTDPSTKAEAPMEGVIRG